MLFFIVHHGRSPAARRRVWQLRAYAESKKTRSSAHHQHARGQQRVAARIAPLPRRRAMAWSMDEDGDAFLKSRPLRIFALRSPVSKNGLVSEQGWKLAPLALRSAPRRRPNGWTSFRR